jgi:hypothetical protein
MINPNALAICTTISQKVIVRGAIALYDRWYDRYPSNHPIVMLEIDKIVSKKMLGNKSVNPTYKESDRTNAMPFLSIARRSSKTMHQDKSTKQIPS